MKIQWQYMIRWENNTSGLGRLYLIREKRSLCVLITLKFGCYFHLMQSIHSQSEIFYLVYHLEFNFSEFIRIGFEFLQGDFSEPTKFMIFNLTFPVDHVFHIYRPMFSLIFIVSIHLIGWECSWISHWYLSIKYL